MRTATALLQRTPRRMWAPGANFGCFRPCAHDRCNDKRAQAALPCCYCQVGIGAGELFVEMEHDGTRVTKQAHLTCSEAMR